MRQAGAWAAAPRSRAAPDQIPLALPSQFAGPVRRRKRQRRRACGAARPAV